SDRLVGTLLMISGLFVFAYYTLWLFVVPFVDAPYFKGFFLDHELALKIPALVIVFGLSGVLGFISIVLIRSG
ncbi:dolichol phosphate-mannose biosynthesis regulatory, partial [Gorgonomyces haynaldii]